MSSLNQWYSDLRFAVRGLVKSPAYVIAFVLTLGLGIGANTAIFSVVNGIWLRPLPYRDGDRVVYLRHAASLAGVDNVLFSVPEIDDYRRQSPSLEGVAEFSSMPFSMIGLDEPRIVRTGIVTGNYFEVMGLGARVGRVISKSEDGQAAPAVAVLTYDYWHRLFGGGSGRRRPDGHDKQPERRDHRRGGARSALSRRDGHLRQHGREPAPLGREHDSRSSPPDDGGLRASFT